MVVEDADSYYIKVRMGLFSQLLRQVHRRNLEQWAYYIRDKATQWK
jgi:hypothetical protein